MGNSRISKITKTRTRKAIFLTFLGIVSIITALFAFGTDLLINFSVLAGKLRGSNDSVKSSQEKDYVPPPTIDTLPSATNSATTKVTGYTTSPNYTIKLYVNGEFFDKKSVKDDKTFSFNNVKLETGENQIKAKAITDEDVESEYSNEATIIYVDKMPELAIDSPQDGGSTSNERISVTGSTDPGNKVTVNDFWAIVNGEGRFNYNNLKLQHGENIIKVVATDAAGNQTIREVKITFSP